VTQLVNSKKMNKKQILKNFTKEIPKGSRVLDIGCGSGKTARLITSTRPDIQLYAIDMEDISYKLPAGVKFSVGLAEDVGGLFGENFFDVVIAQHVIEHLLIPVPMIKGIKKVLKNGGLLYVETPNWTRALKNNHHLRERIAQNGYKLFWEQTTPKKIAKKLLEDISSTQEH